MCKLVPLPSLSKTTRQLLTHRFCCFPILQMGFSLAAKVDSHLVGSVGFCEESFVTGDKTQCHIS